MAGNLRENHHRDHHLHHDHYDHRGHHHYFHDQHDIDRWHLRGQELIGRVRGEATIGFNYRNIELCRRRHYHHHHHHNCRHHHGQN